VLQDVQENFGYISEEVAMTVSRELGVPPIDVYRVATFYKAFTLTPKGKYVVTVCKGTACHVRGSDALLGQMEAQLGVQPGGTTQDGLFSVESVNCLGACALGPVVVVNGKYYDHMTPGKLRKLISSIQRADKEEQTHAQA
jgi:NADH:ubiquinone oxidoreductase subunit E